MSLEKILYEFEHSSSTQDANLNHTIQRLVALSFTIADPAKGNTYARWQCLAQVAASNLTLAKWFESHLDSLSIFKELNFNLESFLATSDLASSVSTYFDTNQFQNHKKSSAHHFAFDDQVLKQENLAHQRSHSDSKQFNHNINQDTQFPLFAVWAAEGSPNPIVVKNDLCSGQKNWCSGASLVRYALMSYKCSEDDSVSNPQSTHLVLVDMQQAGIHVDHQPWVAVGMQHTFTASIHFDAVTVHPVGQANEYLSRVGFWHGAAGVAACWFGATARIAEYLKAHCLKLQEANKLHDYALLYLGEVITEISSTRQYFQYVAQKIDSEPQHSHELIVRILRAKAEQTALKVLEVVGKALGARPFCEDAVFAQLCADLPVFIRQSHAAFDLKQIATLYLEEQLLSASSQQNSEIMKTQHKQPLYDLSTTTSFHQSFLNKSASHTSASNEAFTHSQEQPSVYIQSIETTSSKVPHDSSFNLIL